MTPWEQIQSDTGNSLIYRLGDRQLLPQELDETLRKISSLARSEEQSEGGASDSGANDSAAGGETHARSVLGAVQSALVSLGNCPQPRYSDLLNIAISLEYLEYLKSDGALQARDEGQSIEQAHEQVERIASGWLESGAVSEPIRGHLRKLAQGLIEALQAAQRIGNDRLFVRPEVESAVQADRREMMKAVGELKKREVEILDGWRKTEEEFVRIGITGDREPDEALRNKLKQEASEQGSEGKASQTLSKLADLELRRQDLSNRARQLVDEESNLAKDALEREAKLGEKSSISQLDPRRNFLMHGFDPLSIDADVAKQARTVLSGKLNSLDEKLQEVSEKVPAECRTESGDAVDLLFCCLNRVWKLNRRQEYHPLLGHSDLCEFLFKSGTFYFELVAELQRAIDSLQTLVDEHAQQVTAVQEIKDLVKKGAVFQAEKRMAKIERKFKGVGYRRCDEALQEATRPLREAKRISTEVDDYLSKRKGLMGKLFKDKDALRRLDSEIGRVRSEASSLPKSEFRDTLSALCQKLESQLKA